MNQLAINTDAGNDRVSIVADNEFGDGIDTLGITVDTGDGNDRVLMTAQNDDGWGIRTGSNDLIVSAGDGNDFVSIITKGEGDFDVGGVITLDGGDGTNDRLRNREFPGATVVDFERLLN